MNENVIIKIDSFIRLINFDEFAVDNDFKKWYQNFKDSIKEKLKRDEKALLIIKKLPKFPKERLTLSIIIILLVIKLIFIFFLNSTGIIRNLLPLIIAAPFIFLYREIYYRIIDKKKQKLTKYLNELKSYLTNK